MSLTNTVDMRDEVDIKLRQYVDGIKVRTKGNLNDASVDAEGFFRNLLNLLYDFNLSKDKIESAYNDTIDLHNIDGKICVQVTAQNNIDKVRGTVKHFVDKKRFNQYKELHFMILDREKAFKYDTDSLKDYGVIIQFHDMSTVFRTLQLNFDHPDKMIAVYDFVMKELDKGYAEKVRGEKKGVSSSIKDDDEFEGKHIVEQIYVVLKRFEGFKRIYPRTLSKLYPFNTQARTYDSYSNYCLKTNNIEIHKLLQKINIDESREIHSDDETLMPYVGQLKEIFTVLNNSLIHCICYREEYTEIRHYKILINEGDPNCTCNQCQYHKFNSQPLFSLLKGKAIEHSEKLEEALNEGYYLCKLGEHIKGWKVFDSVAKTSKEQRESIIYFLALYNVCAISKFVSLPWFKEEAKSILPKIQEIDLQSTISDLDIPRVVRDELIRVKEGYHMNFSREKVEEYANIISARRALYAGNGWSSSTHAQDSLRQEMHLLFSFYSSNCIIADDFFAFQSIITKAVDALFCSYATNVRDEYRYKSFDNYVLTMMLFYVDEEAIKKIFETYRVRRIEIESTEKELFITLIKNLLTSQYTTNPWIGVKSYDEVSKQEYFSHYRQLLRHVFRRAMLILSKADLTSAELQPVTQPFVNFLQAVEDFNHSSWEVAAIFLKNSFHAFDEKQIQKIIELAMSDRKHRSGENSFFDICNSAAKRARFVIIDQSWLQKLINIISSPCSSCNRIHDVSQLLALWNIVDEAGKRIIHQKAVDYLSTEFDGDFYETGAFAGVFNKDDNKELLQQYIVYAQNNCHKYDLKQEKGYLIFKNYTGYNCVNCLAYLDVDFKMESVQIIAEKSNFYHWLINYESYDYSRFNLAWLTQACPYYLKPKLYGIKALKERVFDALSQAYDAKLAKFYFKYLVRQGEENAFKLESSDIIKSS